MTSPVFSVHSLCLRSRGDLSQTDFCHKEVTDDFMQEVALLFCRLAPTPFGDLDQTEVWEG